jgi:hypothetical protein
VFTARYGLSHIKPIVLVLQGLSHCFNRDGGCHKTESHVSHRFGQLIYLRTPHSGCEVLQHVLECVGDALLQTVSCRHAKHCNITSPSFLLSQGQVAKETVSATRVPHIMTISTSVSSLKFENGIRPFFYLIWLDYPRSELNYVWFLLWKAVFSHVFVWVILDLHYNLFFTPCFTLAVTGKELYEVAAWVM